MQVSNMFLILLNITPLSPKSNFLLIMAISESSNHLSCSISRLCKSLSRDLRIQLQSLLRSHPLLHCYRSIEARLHARCLQNWRVLDEVQHSIVMRASKVKQSSSLILPLILGRSNNTMN